MRKRQGRFCYEVGMSKLIVFLGSYPLLSLFFLHPFLVKPPFFHPLLKIYPPSIKNLIVNHAFLTAPFSHSI